MFWSERSDFTAGLDVLRPGQKHKNKKNNQQGDEQVTHRDMPGWNPVYFLRFEPLQIIFAVNRIVRDIQHTDWFLNTLKI
jgi:hypothetical protein